jgi:hypothetical protein
MKPLRRAVAVVVGAVALLSVTASAVSAQSKILPTVEPVRTDGGWIYWLAWLSAFLAAITLLVFVTLYMRRAPRFSRDEDEARVVRADRVLPGREPPRRLVDVTQAVPVVAQPPPVLAAAPAAAPAAPAPAPAAAPGSTATAPAPAAEAAAPEAPAPTTEAAEAPAPAPAAAPATAAAPEERVEVTMDQAVYEQTLQELLGSGTDRRIAEGKARRAGMIAARKAAGG